MIDELIFTADDFGMGESVNAGINQCINENLIDSVSVCVNYENDKFLDLQRKDSISVGLHLNVTEGFSLSKSGHLSLQGQLKNAPSLLNSPVKTEIYLAEFRAQFEKYVSYFQVHPNHLDSHQHFAFLDPAAFSALLELSKEHKIPIRSPKPFLNAEGLSKFVERVRAKYQVQLPFSPSRRSKELATIFDIYNPLVRTEELTLNFPECSDLVGEVVCHPSISTNRDESSRFF